MMEMLVPLGTYMLIPILENIGYRLVVIFMDKVHIITWGIMYPSPVMTRLWMLLLMEMMAGMGMSEFMHMLEIIRYRLVKILMEKVLFITWCIISPYPVIERL